MPQFVMVSTNDCSTGEPIPFVAMIVRSCVPAVPAAGVPDNVAVPLELAVKTIPWGRRPDSLTRRSGSQSQ